MIHAVPNRGCTRNLEPDIPWNNKIYLCNDCPEYQSNTRVFGDGEL